MALPDEIPDWLAPIFGALADPTRLRIIGLLDDGDRTVAELTTELGIRQSLVSFHVKRLRDVSLVLPVGPWRQTPYTLGRLPLRSATRFIAALSADRPRRPVR